MPSFLSGQTDSTAIATHVGYTALHIDTPQPSYLDFGTPIFDGSIDWHSSVHAHLATVIQFEESGDAAGLDAFVTARFAPEDVQAEADANVNDVYGWAWLLKLDSTLRSQGYDDLAVAGDAYAARLEDSLVARAAQGTTDLGEGSYGDAFWQVANLHQWAVETGDATLQASAEGLFDAIVADADITSSWSIEDGDFFSAVGIAAYAHVVVGETDTVLFDVLRDTLSSAVNDGSLDALLASEGAALENGAGFGHAPGVPISLGYGYWALFTVTQDPQFYDGFERISEWTETYAEQMGADIGTGHWLPNFATFGLSLPTDLAVPETPELLAALTEYGLDVTPLTPDVPDTPGTDISQAVSFALAGEDAQLFTIEADTGAVSYQDWFSPSFDDAWDRDEDHVYQISIVGFDAEGVELGRDPLEMLVSADGIVWQAGSPSNDPQDVPAPTPVVPPVDAPVDPMPDAPDAMAGVQYELAGPDANLFTIDAATGAVATQDWFAPTVDDPWDADDDNVYQLLVVGADASGAVVSETPLSLTVTASGATWSNDAAAPSDPSDGVPADPDPSDGDPGSPEPPASEPGVTYLVEGPDAFLFQADAMGQITPKEWFVPDFADAWDADENHVYDLELVSIGATGDEIARDAVSFEVTQDSALVQLPTGPDIMASLFVQQDPEEPVETNENEDTDASSLDVI